MQSPPNHWRSAFLVLLAVWILSVGFLGYQIVDQGVTDTYASVSHEGTQRALGVVNRLLPSIQGRDQRLDFLQLLREQNPKGFIVATDSTVEMDGVVFQFDRNGRLKTVR